MPTPSTTVIGSYLSPYVRKVLVCLDLKGVDYQVDPIVPFYGSDEFNRLSPVRRIPVLIDDEVTLCDSSVICEYLEERYPGHALLPSAPAERARARWIEEFADTRMGQVFIWRLFNEVVIRRFVWGEETDQTALEHNLSVDVPEVLDYLESELPPDDYLFGEIGIADIAVAVFFRNAGWAGFSIDPDRWPSTARFVSRVLDHPSFVKLRGFEDLSTQTPIPRVRDALREAGAPITPETLATPEPRRGKLPT